MKPRILVSVIGLNRAAGTKQCIETLLRVRTPDTIIHLTNNGSSDGTGAYFDQVARENSGIIVVHNAENRFFQEPNEIAYAKARSLGCEFFVLCNDDLIPVPNMLQMLMEPLLLNSKGAISGPAGGCYSLSNDMHGTGGGKYEYCEGSLAMFKISIMEKLRPTIFWPELRGIYSEDSEVSLFVQENGYTIHRCNFTPQHARSQTVGRTPQVKAQCESFQRTNHELNKKRWAHYLKVRRFDYPIVVRRKYAIGDVLLTTAVIRAIKQCQPMAHILVETDYPEILARNPDVKGAMKAVGSPSDGLIVNLNMAYENRPGMHILQAYEQAAREVIPNLPPVERKLHIFPDFGSKQWALSIKEECGGKNGKLCVIHPGPTSWPGKNWPQSRFAEVATFMVNHGWHVVIVGSMSVPRIKDGLHLEGKTSINQLAALLGRAQLFIGVDSFPMNCAMAMGCPTIGIFGITSSQHIMTGERIIGLNGAPEIPCVGERHRVHGKTHVPGCREGIESVPVDHVYEAVFKLFP